MAKNPNIFIILSPFSGVFIFHYIIINLFKFLNSIIKYNNKFNILNFLIKNNFKDYGTRNLITITNGKV
jgi:hypothetical protein